ncbi:hypothetical protein CcaCcLH18_07589 [Colletotrichum camelliae]|nr:hypothetical protein CcaCcLH18_07589 [Colletotrichum camelliae]
MPRRKSAQVLAVEDTLNRQQMPAGRTRGEQASLSASRPTQPQQPTKPQAQSQQQVPQQKSPQQKAQQQKTQQQKTQQQKTQQQIEEDVRDELCGQIQQRGGSDEHSWEQYVEIATSIDFIPRTGRQRVTLLSIATELVTKYMKQGAVAYSAKDIVQQLAERLEMPWQDVEQAEEAMLSLGNMIKPAVYGPHPKTKEFIDKLMPAELPGTSQNSTSNRQTPGTVQQEPVTRDNAVAPLQPQEERQHQPLPAKEPPLLQPQAQESQLYFKNAE